MQLVFAATTQVSQQVIAAQATSDEVLLESIANNGKAAMHVFYARHNAQIYKFIFRMVRDTSVAEDIVRQVFLDVWRNARQFEGRSQVSTWLHAIARFKALTALIGAATKTSSKTTSAKSPKKPTPLRCRRIVAKLTPSCSIALPSSRRSIAKSSTSSTTTRSRSKRSER